MDVIELFKAVMVGFFSFMISIGAALSVVSALLKDPVMEHLRVNKVPPFLIFFVILLLGWGFFYTMYSFYPASPSEDIQHIKMIYAYFFALVPSVALMSAVLVYYMDVRSMLRKHTIQQLNEKHKG